MPWTVTLKYLTKKKNTQKSLVLLFPPSCLPQWQDELSMEWISVAMVTDNGLVLSLSFVEEKKCLFFYNEQDMRIYHTIC